MLMNQTQVIESLSKLGFSNGCNVETIIVTRGQNGGYNAAPMGVTRNDSILVVKVFKSSQTYKNLLLGGSISINITDDPLIFFSTAFKDEINNQLQVDDTGLIDADAVIYSEIGELLKDSELKATFSLIPSSVKVNSPYPTVFSRGRSEAIEAIIHSTRIQIFHDQNNDSEVKKLKDKVKNNLALIEKVSVVGSQEYIVAARLLSLLNKWGVEL
jgi:hypothetical protein